MKTTKINSFINKVINAKSANAKEIRFQVSELEDVVLEFSQIITDNHLISFDDLKEALLNSKNTNKKVVGGTF